MSLDQLVTCLAAESNANKFYANNKTTPGLGIPA